MQKEKYIKGTKQNNNVLCVCVYKSIFIIFYPREGLHDYLRETHTLKTFRYALQR